MPAPPDLAIREHRPTDPRWRGDLLAPSLHGRLVADGGGNGGGAVTAAPSEAAGSATAAMAAMAADTARVAGTARELLGDFAPALLLLPATERARIRALLTYAGAVLACGAEQALEGERLARIDRWEAALARALDGDAAAPPICLRMAFENARRRWPADALDELAACARRRTLHPLPASAADAEADARGIARAVGGALLETRLNAEVSGFVAALIRLHALQHLGPATARGRSPLPAEEDRESRKAAAADLGAAVARECARLRPRLLRAPRGLVELPAVYRRAGVFSLLAALRLLSEIEEAGARLLTVVPHLSATIRVGLLARARWFSLRDGLR
jgi:hypothetical protein